ncbi:putative iron-regulated protein [Rhodovulum bhavnagarense]|uniref:Putative iron-regulated protein n=1 Tax=Rhodovulum bhavnagarense TaxID=992286 RepID=A0A4R2RAS1_9RHOB|nr:ChaN family lipoprotein [Rhodovulum bhavnagarense]TCP59823.1 putative iron-regulated protein [Rhodovulum bhavnagarense]
MRPFIFLSAAIALAAGSAGAEQIAPADLTSLPPADVIVLGELHDNPLHHVNQASAVAALRPAALVFEMLTPDQAAGVTPELRDDAAALGAALEWQDSGWPDFAMYHPIFTAAPDAAIFGAALPREEVRRAVGEGAAAVLGSDAALFGLDRPLPEDQKAIREAAQMEAHCNALPEAMLPGMVEAQRLRDAAFARATLKALRETGGPVVVITGNGHARTDWGLPYALGLAAPHVSLLSVGQFEAVPEGDPPYHLWLVTDPADRPDPCAVFDKG